MSRVGGAVGSSRAKTRAFRIVAGFLGVIAFVPSAVFVLGSYTVESQDIHLVHNLSGLAGFGMVFGAAGIAMAARPEDSGAAFRAVAVSAVLSLGAGLLAGDVVTGFWFVGIVFAVALYLLHPDRGDTARVRPAWSPLLAIAVVALVVALVYGVDQAALQRNGIPALDPHADLHHYSGMAVMGGVARVPRSPRDRRHAVGRPHAAVGARPGDPHGAGDPSVSGRPASGVRSGRGQTIHLPPSRALDGGRRDGRHGVRAREGRPPLGPQGGHPADRGGRAADRDLQRRRGRGPARRVSRPRQVRRRRMS